MTAKPSFVEQKELPSQTPSAIADFIQKLTKGMQPQRGVHQERRQTPRYRVSTIVRLQPVDEGFQPDGEAFRAVTRDISAGGLGFADTRPIGTKFVGVRMTAPDGDGMMLMMEVVRCQQRRHAYDIGGRFVTQAESIVE